MFSVGKFFERPTGGVKRFIELYRHLVQQGYDVDLYCGASQENLNANNMCGKTLIMDGPNKGFLGISSHAIYLNNKEIYKEISESNYDCVIAFDVPSTIGLCLANVKNIYYFVRQDLITYRKIQYQDMNMNKVKMNILLLCGWIMEEICVRKSKVIVSQCKYDVDQILSRHKHLKKEILNKMHIQINNINPSWACDKVEISEGEEKEYDIAYVGNFDDNRKGYKLFLDAIEILIKNEKKYKAVMLGGGKELEKCKEIYRDWAIEFPGYVNNPIEYLKKSSLMVVPSYADSCPNTIMESLKTGIPVIGANRSGIPEILTNEEWCFEPEAECIANKINYLLEGDNLKIISDTQSERAKQLTFNWGEAIEKILFLE